MRKRFVLLWTPLALAAALLLPSTTLAASPATFTVLANSCSNNGGRQGYGKSVIQVEQDEHGKSGVTHFRQRAWAQMHYGGQWHTVNSFVWHSSSSAPNTAADHYFIFKFIEDWASDHDSYPARLKWRGEWLDGSGHLLYFKNLYSAAC